MASSLIEEDERIDDRSSCDSWTLIYNKKDKITSIIPDKKAFDENNDDNEEYDGVKNDESYHTEEVMCDSIANDAKEDQKVEQGIEANEKDLEESDDISIISEESEVYQNENEKKDEWKLLRQSCSCHSKNENDKPTHDGNFVCYTICMCSFLILILAICAGLYTVNTALQERVKQLSGIEEKLTELNEFKKALEELRFSSPLRTNEKMVPIKFDPPYPEYVRQKKSQLYNNQEKNYEVKSSYNPESKTDEKLQKLQSVYQNFCLSVHMINSTDQFIPENICETPKILKDLIAFKQNLNGAFDKTQKNISLQKKLDKIDKVLASAAESLLYEYMTVFSFFSLKLQNSFNKIGNKLCQSSRDELIVQVLKENSVFLNNCSNDTLYSNHLKLKTKINFDDSKERKEFKKRNNSKQKKIKNQNNTQMKNITNSKEDISTETNAELIGLKSKGEIVDSKNWEIFKYENQKYVSNNKTKDFDEKRKQKILKKKNDPDSKDERSSNIDKVSENFMHEQSGQSGQAIKSQKNSKNKYELADEVRYNSKEKYDSREKYREKYDSRERHREKYDSKERHREKYDSRERYDSKEEIKNFENSDGEWQMERGRAREKLRNSDNWYLEKNKN